MTDHQIALLSVIFSGLTFLAIALGGVFVYGKLFERVEAIKQRVDRLDEAVFPTDRRAMSSSAGR